MPATTTSLRDAPRVFVVGALRQRLRVTVSGPGADAFAATFSRSWAHLLQDDASAVDRELDVAAPSVDADQLARTLADAASRITLALIELNAGRGLLFHAAAGVDDHGDAFLLIGPSGAGKTTAIMHLARSSGYLTDETALVDADGEVLPYPKPLSVLQGGQSKEQVTPARLGLAVADRPSYRVARMMVVNRGGESAGPVPRSQRLDILESLRVVVPQLSGLGAHPASLEHLVRLIEQVGGIELLTYSDVRDIDPVAGPPTSARLPGADFAFSVPFHSDEPVTAGCGLGRAPVDDAIELADAIVIAQDGQVTGLAGIAMTLWQETQVPRAEGALLARLRDVHGSVPDDDVLFHRTVDDLVERGVLEWRR